MGFQFAFLCDLLSALEDDHFSKVLPTKRDTSAIQIINRWCAQHDSCINDIETDRLALLSCMFPDQRPDRVYWLQATSLARVIGRCLRLGSSRLTELGQWKKPGGPDLGKCVENVMSQAENYVPPGRGVTVEEIDTALNMIASRCRFSGPDVRRQHTAVNVDKTLSPLYRRLSSRDAKWLTRLILRGYPLTLPLKYTLGRIHFLLPPLLQFQNTFEGALEMLSSEPMNRFPPNPDGRTAARLSEVACENLYPRTGIKVGRPDYFKARSIKHCLQLVEGRRMSVERKYDGEYCQIHIDLTQSHPIQVFSKSGKDSTADRAGIAPILEETLHLNHTERKFTRKCILEAELVVWSDKRGGIADFHKLRKFICRSGTLIGVDNDSPPQPYEHLMLVFFDVLLLDDDVCLRKPHRERRLLLQRLIDPVAGRAALAEQEVMRFDRVDRYERLDLAFSRAIAQRWEGLVLKACDEPYFPIHSSGIERKFGGWIKLKKDYIPGLGDTVDLNIIGAYYDSRHAHLVSPQKPLKWTHFLVGCLLNKKEVMHSGDRPRFRVIDVLNHHSMHRNFMQLLNQHGEFQAQDPGDFVQFAIEYGHANTPAASVIFKKTFPVELMGAGFEKPSGARYYTLRFPRILKIHTDRSFEDSASFQELQNLADEARSVPKQDQLEEQEHWRNRLRVGSGYDLYIRSETPPRGSSSESGGSPSSKDSNATASYEESDDCLDSIPTGHEVHQEPRNIHNDRKRKMPPTIYIDDPGLPASSGGISNRSTALTEIGNLSQSNKQPRREVLNGASTKPVQLTNSSPHNPDDVATSKEPSAYIEMLGCASSLQSPPLEKGLFIKSPLVAIPTYSPSSQTSTLEFLESLAPKESMPLVQQFHPQAASTGTAFGIILINPAEVSLGPKIHEIAKAVHNLMKKSQSCLPCRGAIFFLDQILYEQRACPESSDFCLRTEWPRIGRELYYACVRWDFSGPRGVLHSELDSHRGKPGISVSFEPSHILELADTCPTIR
ncbi:hypothetical protein N7470_006384 [Penicillium chermesinum]|nr:hypothetical protein N7470_006384 [Penicillium chermesinum]